MQETQTWSLGQEDPLIQMDKGWPVHIFSRKCSLNELLLLLEIYHIPQVCCCCCLVTTAMSDSVQPHELQPVRLLCPWDSLGNSSGVGCHALFQGILPTQELNQGLLHCRWILYQLSYQGTPNCLLSRSYKPSAYLIWEFIVLMYL